MSLSEFITINGVELRNVLADAHVVDITVGAIEREHTATPKVIFPGSFFAQSRPGIRKVTVSVELPWDREHAIMNYGRLISWAKSDQPVPMVLPNNQDRCIHVVFAGASELNVKEWYLPVDLSFVAYDPYFYSRTVKQKAVGSEIYNAGCVSVPFRIEAKFTSSVSNPAWIIDNSVRIALSGSVGAGSIVIDTVNETVKLNGESIASQLSFDSRFVDLAPGKHMITGPEASVFWTEGWE